MSLKKNILITGANSGIGRSSTEYLASKGFNIFAGARKDKDIDSLNDIENVMGLKIDVTDNRLIQNAFDFIINKNIKLDGIINNAGIAEAGPLMDISIDDMISQFNVNIFGVHRIMLKFFPLILESKGRIIMNPIELHNSSSYLKTSFNPTSPGGKKLITKANKVVRKPIIEIVQIIHFPKGIR